MARSQQKIAGIKEKHCNLTLTVAEMKRLNSFLRRRERFADPHWMNYSRMTKQEALDVINGR